MKHMKIWLIPLILLLCTSCRETAEIPGLSDFKPAEKYAMPDLPETAYIMGEDTLTVYPYGGRIYGAGKTLFYRDTATGEDTVLASDLPGEAYSLYVDEGEIFLLAENTVTVYTHEGVVTEEYMMAYDAVNPINSGICGNRDGIFLAYNTMKEDEWWGCLFHISRETGTVTELYLPDDCQFTGVYALEPGIQRDEAILFPSYYYEGSELGHTGKFLLKADGTVLQKQEYVYNIQAVDYLAESDAAIGIVPNASMMGNSVFSVAWLDHAQDYTNIRHISRSVLFPHIKHLEDIKRMNIGPHNTYYFTGTDIYLWDRYNHAIFIIDVALPEGSDTLTILYPKQTRNALDDSQESDEIGYMEGETVMPVISFEEKFDCRVLTKAFQIHDFNDRLRMKLLAGDTDYDVVYLENASPLLASILNYDLYLPLEDDQTISQGFEHYMDGVRDVMSDDGHLYGIPYKLTGSTMIVRKQYETLGLPEWQGTDLMDFWTMCEAAREQNWDTIVMGGLYDSLLVSLIEDSGAKGKIDKELLTDLLIKYKTYHDCGVISSGFSDQFLYPGTSIPFAYSSMEYRDAYSHLVPYPTVDGHQYVEVNSMIFAPKVTKNPELAKAYLGLLVSDEFVGEKNNYRSLLLKNSDGYFSFYFREMIGGSYDTVIANGYEVMRNRETAGAMAAWVTEHANEVWTSVKPRRYSLGLDDLIYELREGLIHGEITPEDAADKLIDEVSTRLWE